ncbi:MAG: DUF4416 family protein [Deltaproteobacteria bacterium]|nr:DUF4416 family protein [Deltaproteobacteria bacterium]
MSKPKEPLPAKLGIGIIYQEERAADSAWRTMEKIWGALDVISEVRPFDYTGYYEEEMGRPLVRRWAFFRELVHQDRLTDIKWQALEIEKQWTVKERRLLNLDPGLITAERLVLATGKNFSHRIYLGRGIFGDLTLVFSKGTYRPLAWTYPDYKDEQAITMFNKIREKYLRQIADFGLI